MFDIRNIQPVKIFPIRSHTSTGIPNRRNAFVSPDGHIESNALDQSKANINNDSFLVSNALSIIRRIMHNASVVPRPDRNPNYDGHILRSAPAVFIRCRITAANMLYPTCNNDIGR